MEAQRKIGIWGGCFNPPTIGHLLCAEYAREELGLDEVWFVPVGRPSHKEMLSDPGRACRKQMVEAAIEGNSNFRLEGIELERAETSYSFDTLQTLAGRHPEAQFWLLMGGDEAISFTSWKNWKGILDHARLGVCLRAGIGEDMVRERLFELNREQVDIFHLPTIEVSSTEVRRRCREGKSIRYLVPAGVERIVHSEGLYSTSRG